MGMSFWKLLLNQGLTDDRALWDWTTRSLPPKKSMRARIHAKQDGIWSASGLVPTLKMCATEWGWDDALQAKSKFADGQEFKNGDVLMELQGSADAILRLERPALNLASYSCGIATQTRQLVDQVQSAWKKTKAKGAPPRVTHIRKILPYYRDLALHSVLCGGGFPHRLDLSSGVLLKENHIAYAGGVAQALKLARATAPHLCKIEIEVRNETELAQALENRADVVMLDNFKAADLNRALALVDLAAATNGFKTLIEISGGLTPETIAARVLPGVDILSSGWITHSVTACDFSLLVEWTPF